jgi:hypothetical protein
VASGLVVWGWKLKPEWCDGLATAEFIRYHLPQFDLGHDLDYVIRGNTKRRIAPVEEVLTLCPKFEPAG